jgi:ribosomal protein S15P/S13E
MSRPPITDASPELKARIHAGGRYKERYGKPLTDAVWDEHHLAILAGESVLVAKQHHGNEKRELHLIDDEILCVWCDKIRRILTYLPREEHALYRAFIKQGRPVRLDRISTMYRRECMA